MLIPNGKRQRKHCIMRTIKFRAKLLSLEQWSYGYPAKIDCNWHMITDDDFEEDGHHLHQISDMPTWVKEDTIGQFTGLCDKNGKEIFEGDILLWTRKNVHIEGRPIQDLLYKCIIYYDNDECGFRFRCKLDCGSCVGNLDFSDDRAKESYIEVVGNIYDNPELLKE